MYHYVYKLELPETKEYYFGSRTSKVEPIKDIYYLGSMKTWKPDKKKLVKITKKNSPLFTDFNSSIFPYSLSACKTTNALFQGRFRKANNGYHLKNRLYPEVLIS